MVSFNQKVFKKGHDFFLRFQESMKIVKTLI